MSDRRKDRRIVAPSPGVVSLDEARAEKDEARIRSADGSLSDYVTRREMIKGVTNAAMAMGEKMYEQFSDETREFLTQMEADITASVTATVLDELERRSLRGRVRALAQWVRRTLSEFGTIERATPRPAITMSAAQMDALLTPQPGMLAELRRLIEQAGPNDTIDLPKGTTAEDAQRIHQEVLAARAACSHPGETRPLPAGVQERRIVPADEVYERFGHDVDGQNDEQPV